MDALPMDTFRMGGIEFGISFVAREKSVNDLKSVAGQHGLKLIFVDDLENGDMINVLSRKDVKIIKNEYLIVDNIINSEYNITKEKFSYMERRSLWLVLRKEH